MMKNIFGAVLFFFISAGIVAAGPADGTKFIGQWQCRMSYMGSDGPANDVSFDSSGTAVLGGRRFSYTVLAPNILRLQGQAGISDYRYEFSGDNLTLSYQDGSVFHCSRSGGMGGGGVLGGRVGQSGGNSAQTSGGAGNEWQLQGTLCNWSGSSSSYSSSSYSSTRRISFDGRGHWTFGSESSFSGTAGMAYGGQGGQESGTYRVAGNQIYYTTATGEQGVAQVHMRQDNGRITEIMVDGALYATGLCD
ncbi:MAG: hypothetical protein B6I22_06030 [Desulfobacteraceae bacterium 4572_123]|nr:MAG: hypothetical protein B6I22_06030 [Desulfobacteraceae bacterium 4572_123]